MNPAPTSKLAYSVKEAVSLLPWGKSKIYELIACGELPTRFKHGHRYVMHADLMALLMSVEPDALGEKEADAA